jgi:hypothetical protein
MAITIVQEPVDYSSVHDEAWYDVSSTNSSNIGFKYVCDIYIGATIVARIKSFPQPSTLRGLFNVSNVLRNYINNPFTPASSHFAWSNMGLFVNYSVQFGEEYGGTLYTNLENRTDVRLYDYAVDYLPTLDRIWTGDGLSYQADYEGQVLSRRQYNAIQIPNAQLPSSFFISAMGLSDVNDFQTTIRHYTNGVWSPYISLGWSYGNDKLMVFNISPYAINQTYGSQLITSNTTKYEIELGDDPQGTFATLLVTTTCIDKYTPAILHFQNSLGGWDSFSFSLVNRQTRNNESKSFEQAEWQLNPSNLIGRYDSQGVFYGGSKTFSTLQTITYKLISDYVVLPDYYWLNDLIRSTSVYLSVGVDYYMPVTIKTNNWVEKKRYTDKVYNLELDIEISAKTNSQYK